MKTRTPRTPPRRRSTVGQILRNAYLRFVKDPAAIAIVHRVLGKSRCWAAVTLVVSSRLDSAQAISLRGSAFIG